jgi:gluconolactonase
MVSVVDETLYRPNGITLSLDENTLYVADPDDVYRYTVDATGAVSNRMPFNSDGGSDGMGIDCAGNLYVTRGSNVVVYDSAGGYVDSIPVDVSGSVTNVAFGGPERKTLFITSLGDSQRLHYVELAIPGLPY